MEIFPLAAKEPLSDHAWKEVNTNEMEASHPISNLHQKLISVCFYCYY